MPFPPPSFDQSEPMGRLSLYEEYQQYHSREVSNRTPIPASFHHIETVSSTHYGTCRRNMAIRDIPMGYLLTRSCRSLILLDHIRRLFRHHDDRRALFRVSRRFFLTIHRQGVEQGRKRSKHDMTRRPG